MHKGTTIAQQISDTEGPKISLIWRWQSDSRIIGVDKGFLLNQLSIALLFELLFLAVSFPSTIRGQDAFQHQAQEVTNSIGMKLVPIPAGRFTMGSPASERGSEEDEVLHKVDITQPFHLGATEVTEHQWAMVMEESFRTEMVEIRDPDTKRLVKKEERQIKNPKWDSQLPVTGVSWLQAGEFCKRLGQLPEEKKEGRNYRLPREAEWEYACRAGTSTAFCCGDDVKALKSFAWYTENCYKRLSVAQRRPNAWGLFDMHGNVSEWCYDYYGDYPEELTTDPIGPKESPSHKRVVRGGGFESKALQCRSGWRGKSSGDGESSVGFRVLSTLASVLD